jgi:choloylglycine hydrolase
MAAKNGIVLVGNNEDWKNRNTKMWFIPASGGNHGRVCFGFEHEFGFAQGGMNDQGLFIDANALAPTGWIPEEGKPTFRGAIMDTILTDFATVDEAIAFFKKYNVPSLARARFPIADRTGASVIVEWANGSVQFVRKTGDYQISTNFVVSNVKDGNYPCWRYNTADKMFGATNDISVEFIRSVLDATHQEGRYATVYSNIYDLIDGIVYLYNLYDFENVIRIDLARELKKGRKSVDIPSLFSK